MNAALILFTRLLILVAAVSALSIWPNGLTLLAFIASPVAIAALQP